MSKAKDSPGPWKQGTLDRRIVYDAGGNLVAKVKNIANVPLIAAAPDLLAACEAILSNDGCNTANDDGVWICVFCRGEWEESGCNHSDGCPIIMAKAAIAAAKGE